MEKQGKRKFVDQNITEPKTLLCAARKIEETPSSAVITGKEEKTDTMGLSDQDRRNLKISLAVTESLSSNYKPVTGNDIARSAHVTAIETMFVEGNASHFFDELDCNNFASPNNLSVAYKEPVTENDIARRAHVTAIETMFVDGFARHSFDKLDCKNFASPDLLSVAYNDDHLTGYMQKGSLENHLFKRHSTPLPWTTRSKIAVANGLAFLHGPKKPVIYRDFKASNILLDSDYNAKLSDFGLAKDGLRVEDTHVSTRVMDNQMDATPEYTMTGNMFYQEGETELHQSYGNVRRHPEFQHDYTYKHSQHIRKDIVQCLSSSVVSVVVSLGIFYNIWSSQLSIFQVQSLHKEHSYRLSIWPSFLGLFGFMVFVCAVAVMNLVGAPFTSMQKAMLIFLAILMHLQSANSIIEVFVTLVGGLSMGWHAFGKKKTTK